MWHCCNQLAGSGDILSSPAFLDSNIGHRSIALYITIWTVYSSRVLLELHATGDASVSAAKAFIPDPFGGNPLLSLDNRTAAMKSMLVKGAIWMYRPEQQRISRSWLILHTATTLFSSYLLRQCWSTTWADMLVVQLLHSSDFIAQHAMRCRFCTCPIETCVSSDRHACCTMQVDGV